VQDGFLFRVEVGDLHLEAGVCNDGAEGSGERALAGAALLRHERDDDGLRWHGTHLVGACYQIKRRIKVA
jgi:hypothetical protein